MSLTCSASSPASPLGIAEAKYYGTVDWAWRDALRAAVAQIVRYARLYDDTLPNPILGHSLAALRSVPPDVKAKAIDRRFPLAIGLDDLIAGDLQSWVNRLFSPHPEGTEAEPILE